MKSSDYSNFYQTLSPLEKDYWHRLHTLFQQVHPQKPEKGIYTLLLRARKLTETKNLPLEEALQQTFEGATQRTLRRVEKLKQCRLPEP